MTWYELWLFLHIAAAIVWIGGAATAQVFAVLAKRSGNPARTLAFGRDISFVGSRIFLPASIVVLVTGVALTEDGGWDWSKPLHRLRDRCLARRSPDGVRLRAA